MKQMVEEVRKELTGHITPFWKKLADLKNGGFYGYMDYDLKLDKDAEKGVILNSRILWFFANSYLTLQNEEDLTYAQHAYEFLRNRCYDEEYGGVYWMMDAKGNVVDDVKHTYNQAFAIYALSSYFDASGDKSALELAFQIYQTIEDKCRDDYGYVEAFSRDFHPISNELLSENGVLADKTMNTILHLLEAYTELYRVSHDDAVAGRLRYLLETVRDHVYNPEKNILEVFFDVTYHPIIDMHSYGHDIEAAWLIDRACDVLGDEAVRAEMEQITLALAKKVREVAIEDGVLNNERDKDHISRTRVWWVEAEGVVGFLNAYQHSGITDYRDTAKMLWEYIKQYIIDPREGSEWLWAALPDNTPGKKPIVEPWKCPYHNGRMCMEVIRRYGNV